MKKEEFIKKLREKLSILEEKEITKEVLAEKINILLNNSEKIKVLKENMGKYKQVKPSETIYKAIKELIK